jgi:hypothetical protein
MKGLNNRVCNDFGFRYRIMNLMRARRKHFNLFSDYGYSRFIIGLMVFIGVLMIGFIYYCEWYIL